LTYGSGGLSAQAVVVADVNGDGKPDLVVANCRTSGGSNCGFASGSVGVLLGNGDGTFQAAATYGLVGYGSVMSVAVADVNGDGKPDLLVAVELASDGFSGAVNVLLGNGDGTFQAAVPYGSGGVLAQSVAVADVNGDGKPDLVVANQDITNSSGAIGSVGMLLGNGDGTFQAAVSYGSGGYFAFSVAVADLNGDGKPDLLVANLCEISECLNSQKGTVGVLFGNGDGTFQAAATYSSGGYFANSVAVADVNGDGKPDLLVLNQSTNQTAYPKLGVLFGNGDGTFQAATTYNTGGLIGTSMAVADVNGDGKPDVVVANQCAIVNFCNTGSLGVLLGNGDGTFQAPVPYGSGGISADSVAVGDVNGDGKPDLVVANLCADSNCANGSVGVLINTSPSPYKAFVQQPINADGSSFFKANRGVIPVKFTLTLNDVPTCTLPPAAIAVTRTAGGTLGSVGESTYSMAADSRSNFRIDPTACQYIYNLAASSLGVGTYRVDISINGSAVGSAVFALK
jgi:hypothetical protein